MLWFGLVSWHGLFMFDFINLLGLGFVLLGLGSGFHKTLLNHKLKIFF